MTRTERKQIAAAFRACLPYLWNGSEPFTVWKEEFICYALEATDERYSEQARRIVSDRIGGGPYCTLNDWLILKIGKERYIKEVTPKRMQAYRRAWVRKLIKEFES